MLMFAYKDEKALLKAQKVLIDLGYKLIEIINESIEEVAPTCWSLLNALLRRGEFTLAHMGYSKSQKEEHLQGKPS